jgi:hypothetical protein
VIEEAMVACPACGEQIPLEVDTMGGREQSYVEDCSVCCRPMEIRVRCVPGEILEITAAGD